MPERQDAISATFVRGFGSVASVHNETFDRHYSPHVPMERLAKADELVGALVFLAIDASSYVDGQEIAVDGGLAVW